MKKSMRRMVAFLLVVVMTLSGLPIGGVREVKAADESFTLDFCAATDGAMTSNTALGAVGIVGAIDLTTKTSEVAPSWMLTTSLKGTGWTLNTEDSDLLKVEGDASLYSSDSAYYHRVKNGKSTLSESMGTTAGHRCAIRLYPGRLIAFDFEAPSKGSYLLEVGYRSDTKEFAVMVNNTVATSVEASVGTNNYEYVTDAVTVDLVEGTNTIIFETTSNDSYAAFRAVKFTKLEDEDATKKPFEIDISTVDISTTHLNGSNYYFSKDTVGSNWAVHSNTQIIDASKGNSESRARIFLSGGVANRVTLYKKNVDFTLAFTAPASGYYDLSADMYWHEDGGYADVYVNDAYVGSVDSLKGSGINEQKLLGVYLNEGTLANKISIIPTGVSTGSGYKTYWCGFNFTTPETIATLTGIELVTETTSMFVGDTQTIVGNAILSNGGLYRLESAGDDVLYESSNEAVAQISNDGTITALSAGNATISVTVLGCSGTVDITVIKPEIDSVEINLEEGQTFTEGDTFTLEPKAKLINDTYADESEMIINYESSNAAVARVENGVLVAVSPGTATITTHISYEGKSCSVTRTVTVEEYIPPVIFEVTLENLTNVVGTDSDSTVYLSANSAGENWTVSTKTDAPLATDENNLGSCRIFANGDLTYLTLYKKQQTFVFDVDVENAGNYDITANMIKHTNGGYAAVYVNDVYVGTVDTYSSVTDKTSVSKQKLLGVTLQKGSNTIGVKPLRLSGGSKYTAMLAGFSFTMPDTIATITAIDAIADVDNMYVGRKEQISIDAVLSNGGFYEFACSTETFTYKSSNTRVATVSSSGLITGVGAGKTTITVTAKNGGWTDKITFTVSEADYDKVEMNLMDGGVLSVSYEKALQVVATLTDGTEISQKDLTVVYSSNNEDVAKIEDGVLKAVAKGNATITAKATFRIDGTTKTDVKQIAIETISLQGVTAELEKPVVQELDVEGVPLIVKCVAEDGTIIEDLALAGFTSVDCTYTSLTPEILSIDENGICRYVSRGTAQVKVKAVLDGVPYECVVDVVSSSQKTGRTLFTDEMIANAQYNVQTYDWAVSELNKRAKVASQFISSYDAIYELIPSEGLPRSNNNSTLGAQNDVKWHCPSCGVNFQATSSDWQIDPFTEPWKIWCSNCKIKFPTNDFALLYERGLDENGQYNRELAYANNKAAVARGEKDALVNELYPEKGATWMVDDGFGWSPTSGTYGTKDLIQYAPIAKYMDLWWSGASKKNICYVLTQIQDYYLWTGDEQYGRVGAILLDRVADVYPDYDITKVSLNYHNSSGGSNAGKIAGSIAEEALAEIFIECYDAFYPMFDDPEVVAFLSEKAAEKGLQNPKTNGNLIRENVENGIIREVMDALYTAQICGNFGYHQNVSAKVAVALDTQPETDEMLYWLCAPSVVKKQTVVDPIFGQSYTTSISNSGGEMAIKYVNEIDRDGFGAEVSVAYNTVWTKGIKIAEILKNYGTDILDLYSEPKFLNMFDSFIHLTAGNGYTLPFGDGGNACSSEFRTNLSDDVISGYKITRDPLLAQIYYALKLGNINNAQLGIYNNIDELSQAIFADVETYGTYKLTSENLTGYGFAIVRDGELVDGYETRYDTWMYYGRTTGSHAHLDMLHMGIDAYGFNFMPDLGSPEAKSSSANRHEWVRNTISHNTVTVDGLGQSPVYTGTPLHFDSTDNVKLIDTESSDSYEQTDIYRRTAVTIAANDDVSYTLDFFRVKGGNQHTYSFHSQSYMGYSTEDLNLVPQVDENGEYVGTYAGVDVSYGPDPNSTDNVASSSPVYPRGYTWFENVNRGTDKTGDGLFTINFTQTDFNNQVKDSEGLAIKVHALNDWTADSVDIMTGYAPRIPANSNIPGLDYMLIQRTGENLDTLFTTLLEPYKTDDYILQAKPLSAAIKAGTEGEDDVVKVIKVTLKNGRIDYVIYATNADVTYTVTDGKVNFDFKGFVGVYSVDSAGNNVYTYANDGTIIGDRVGIGAYTGTVVDFTKERALDNYITIKTEQTVKDVSLLINQYIYVDNDAKCNGVYRILSAEKDGGNIVLYLGNCSVIDSYKDDYDLDAGFIYTIEEGQNFRIPLSVLQDKADIEPTPAPTATPTPAPTATPTPAPTATPTPTPTPEPKYTVTWVNIDGTVLEVDADLEPGMMPSYDSTEPTMTSETATLVYTGWDKTIMAVTEDVTYTATYYIDGIYGGYYYVDGIMQKNKGVIEYGDDLYFVCYSGALKMGSNQTITTKNSNGLVAAGTYYFNENGVMRNPADDLKGYIYEDEAGELWYYVKGEVRKNVGTVKIGDYYYYVCYSGKIAAGRNQTVASNKLNGYDVEAKTYYFFPDGVMETREVTITDGEVGEDGKYYVHTELRKNTGVVKIGDYFYYVCYSGLVAAGRNQTVSATKTNGFDVAANTYYFYGSGKGYGVMATAEVKLSGEVKANEKGELCYYVFDELTKNVGLVKMAEDDYIFVQYSGKIRVSGNQTITEKTCNGHTEFIGIQKFVDGKMVIK